MFTQLHSKSLGKVVDIVVSHQALPAKLVLVEQLLNALVLPSPEHYRPLLRRLAVLGMRVKTLLFAPEQQVCPSIQRRHRCA